VPVGGVLPEGVTDVDTVGEPDDESEPLGDELSETVADVEAVAEGDAVCEGEPVELTEYVMASALQQPIEMIVLHVPRYVNLTPSASKTSDWGRLAGPQTPFGVTTLDVEPGEPVTVETQTWPGYGCA